MTEQERKPGCIYKHPHDHECRNQDDMRERPRTEAGRRLVSGPNMSRAFLSDVLAIEAEGRQQAVREIADTLTEHSDHLPITSDGENLRCSPDDAILVAGLKEADDYGIDPIRDDVEAGLNASEHVPESPPPDQFSAEVREYWRTHPDPSEPIKNPLAKGIRDIKRAIHETPVRDASESGRCNKDAYCFRPSGHFGGCTPNPTPASESAASDE